MTYLTGRHGPSGDRLLKNWLKICVVYRCIRAAKEAVCKTVGYVLRRFESSPVHHRYLPHSEDWMTALRRGKSGHQEAR